MRPKHLAFKKVTSTSIKSVGVPKTQGEKFDFLAKKNPALEKLRDVFGLEFED